MTDRADILIIGAGIAGASLAAELGPQASVILLEAEAQPGYHSTGRSAAFWSESYGGALIQPLTTASRPLLADPPAGFAAASFLSPRGAIHLADAAGAAPLAGLESTFTASGVALERLDAAHLHGAIPGLRDGWCSGLFEPTCADIDVAALHAAYLRAALKAGGRLFTDARVQQIERGGDRWRIRCGERSFAADLIVNAAGAWAGEVAALANAAPIAIQPYRRTIAQLRVAPAVPPSLPLVIDALGRFYFKPESGRLWLSPHDETACAPSDCAAEEYDIALAIDWLQQVVDWKVERVEHSWAGLRSFAPDRLPVYGFDTAQPGFFWCAGQGGFGIQTAPAAAKLAASLLLGRPELAPDIDPAPYLAARFAN